MKESAIKLSDHVVLIDAAFLNLAITDLKLYFEQSLDRLLPDIDLPELMIYLMLDAGVQPGDNEIQFLLVYDKECSKLAHCHPSGLADELDGVAFKCEYGEFAFMGVPCEGLVSRADLFLDLLHIVADSKEVRKLTVVSFNEEYGDRVTKDLNAVEGKEVVQFRMSDPDRPVDYRWDMLAFSLMRAFGIRGDELE